MSDSFDEVFQSAIGPGAEVPRQTASEPEPLVRLDIGGPAGLHFTFRGSRPGWFHRLVQRVLLGFRWTVVRD